MIEDEFNVVKEDRSIDQSIDDIFNYWINDESKRAAFKMNMFRLLNKERSLVKALPTESEKLIKFIANDYIELSHDKVMWQRNDWLKRAKKVLWG